MSCSSGRPIFDGRYFVSVHKLENWVEIKAR